jgi:hypothetical protein
MKTTKQRRDSNEAMKIKQGIMFPSITIILFLLLQLYQMVRFEFGLSRASHPYNACPSSISSSKQPEYHSHQEQEQEQEESFSACLMFMDDNAHLIEWLGYHYHTLPLRRLIIGIDPRSQTLPTNILERWAGRIEITEWTDVDFMPPHEMSAHVEMQLKEDAVSAQQNDALLTALFRHRQEEFYTRCMARLKYEGKKWVSFVDTDEYITVNKWAMGTANLRAGETARSGTTTLSGATETTFVATTTVLQTLRMANETNPGFSDKLAESPCVAMARLRFGVKESSKAEISNGVPTNYFNPHDFQTLNWRWHAGRGMKAINKISKCILDVSRVHSSLIIPKKQVMVHMPIRRYCKEEDLGILNARSPLVVHHYGGTWEQWSHRQQDSRGKRTREAFDKMKYGNKADDSIRAWLEGFVQQVGLVAAQRLLQGVGQVPRT